MIRILFTIVAVVAAILAVIMQQPLLFVGAGASLGISIVLMVTRLQRRRSGYKKSVPSKADDAADEDLASLGILEIRPRGRSGEEGRTAEESAVPPNASAAESAAVAENGAAAEAGPPRNEAAAGRNGARDPSPVQSTFAIREKAQIVRASVDESAPGPFRDVLVPYLQAFRAAVDANTVCLLKQPDETPHYHIEAIVSLNAYARSSGTFSAKRPFLDRFDLRAAPQIRSASAGSLASNTLGYYREPIAVKEFAAVPVPIPTAGPRYVLVADAMQEETLTSDRVQSLIGHFARLLGAVLDRRVDDPAVDESDGSVRPRREIIGEEIERAQREEVPLALALVYLNRAEEIADLGEQEIASAERLLSGHLRTSARDGRVERFGELTFGVFFKAGGPEVERWAVELQRELEAASGALAGGVSIGIALLDERHVDADSFRRDATDALREAYESGTCTIVE